MLPMVIHGDMQKKRKAHTRRSLVAIISITVLISLCFVLYSAKNTRRFIHFSEKSKLSLPAIHVDIHSHNRSKDRLERGEQTFRQTKYFKDGTISTVVVVPKNFSFISKTPMLITDCGGLKAGSHDYVCRVQAGHDNFLDRFPEKNWFVRAIDDSWIDDENLIKYISQLETFIDPRKHIVAKATRNNCFANHPFLHGGAGWLVSRALLQYLRDSNVTLTKLTPLAYQHQDDTAMSVVFWKLFPKFEYWDDFHIVSPYRLNMEKETDSFTNYTHLGNCSRECKLVKARDIFLLHLLSWSKLTAQFGESIRTLPDFVYLCRIDDSMNFCRAKDGEFESDSFDLEWLKSTTPVVTAEDYRNTFIDNDDVAKIKALKTALSKQDTVSELPTCNLLRDPLDPRYRYGVRILWDASRRRFSEAYEHLL